MRRCALLDSLSATLGHSWWAYPLIFGICTFDVVLPSETMLLTAGILSADGSMMLGWVIVMAALGAFAGDNITYWIGHSADDWARRWIARGERGRRNLDWARRALERHGGPLVIVARFLPGGRTATTLACGVLGFPYRQFAVFDAIGAALWATLNTMIGFLGGQAFEDRPLMAFAVSFGVALAAGALAEFIRWFHQRRSRRKQDVAGPSRD